MSFPRYKSYKESDVEWLGEVPEHWGVSSLKHKIRLRYGDALASDIREEGEIEVFGSNGAVGLHSVANTKAPAIIVGRKGSYGKIVWAENGGFVIDTAYSIDSDTTSSNLRWVYYALQPLGLDSLSQDTGVPGLAREKAYEMRISVPSEAEQQTISAFLDRETAKIDALIAEQQRLIELLKEKRQAVISHAVTKGLNPDAPMKDSGIEWLGEVPEHWDVSRLKFLMADIKAGPFGSALTKDMYVNAGYRIYGQEQVIPNDFSVGDYYITEEKYQELKQYQVAAGDILISCVGTFGKIAIVPSEIEPGIINPRLMRLRCSPAVGAEYLVVLLRSIVVFEQFSLLSRGGTMDVINIGTLNEIVLPIPEIGEQETILRFIEKEIAKVDALTAEAQTAITLLQERRSALVSAAVTGKIDVRGMVAALPQAEVAAA